MLDKIKFMETLRSVAEIARVSTTPLTKDEINGYFDSMELSEEQQEMVYQYLLNPVEDEPMEEPVQEETVPSENPNDTETKIEESKYLKMYMEEIQEIPGLSLPEEQEAYVKLIDGDATVTQSISDHWLTKVVSIAKSYEKHNVNIEDIIQEGNIGLLMGIQELLGSHKMIDVEEFLKESVQKAMEDFIDEMNTEDDWESTVLAKTTLIHEASQAMEQNLGRTPTVRELSDFTKISEDEINDIFHLSLEDESAEKEENTTKQGKDASIDPWFHKGEEK